MKGSPGRSETPTRREYVKYGGSVVAGGLLAGCSSGGEPGDGATPTDSSDGTAADTEAATATEPESYSVSMEPMGSVSFDEPPETWLAFLSTYGDVGIALGQADGLRGLWNTENVPTAFYDALPGVDVDFDEVTTIGGEDGLDKEILYELDCDLHLVDPNWIEVIADDWTEDDTEEVAESVGPFLGNYLRRRGDDWHDYRYYDLYEAFEVVADAFRERERYEAMRSIHDQAQARIADRLPSEGERPSVGLVSVNSDFENGSFYVYPVQDGNNHKQYRDLEMRDAFADHIDGSYAQWDYEQFLEVDPDALLFQYGFSHVSAEEFETLTERMGDDPTGSQLSAVQNGRLYRGGASYQGPIVDLFQTEAAARQFYPDAFGEWDGISTLDQEDLTLFDRQRVADVIEGEV